MNPVSRNRYAYANGNPVKYRDPSGHFAQPLISGDFGGVLGDVIDVQDTVKDEGDIRAKKYIGDLEAENRYSRYIQKEKHNPDRITDKEYLEQNPQLNRTRGEYIWTRFEQSVYVAATYVTIYILRGYLISKYSEVKNYINAKSYVNTGGTGELANKISKSDLFSNYKKVEDKLKVLKDPNGNYAKMAKELGYDNFDVNSWKKGIQSFKSADGLRIEYHFVKNINDGTVIGKKIFKVIDGARVYLDILP